MKLELLGDRTLRVTLSRSDLGAYSLSCDGIDYSNTETRRALWDIFDRAKHETGFDAAASRVYIQVYPDSTGGCEIYASRVCGEPDGDSGVLVHNEILRSAVFRFHSLSELIRACRALLCGPFRPRRSRLFFSDGEYFLEIVPDGGSVLCEYGESGDAEDFSFCSGEMCELLISENAVETLANRSLP